MQKPVTLNFMYLHSLENLLENIGYKKTVNIWGHADFVHKEKGIKIHALRFLDEWPRQWYGIFEIDNKKSGKRYTACVFLEEKEGGGVVKTYSGIKQKLDLPDNVNAYDGK